MKAVEFRNIHSGTTSEDIDYQQSEESKQNHDHPTVT